MSLVAVDTFEPWYARVVYPVSVLAIIIGIVLLIAAVRKAAVRKNPTASGARGTSVTAAVLVIFTVVALASSLAYHFRVRLPRLHEYEEAGHPAPALRQALNMELRDELLSALFAVSIPVGASLVARRAVSSRKPQPNSG